MAIAAIDRETEVTYIRRERDWATRAAAAGRLIDTTRMLPMLPPVVTGVPGGNGNGHGHSHGDGHGHDGGTAVVPSHHE